MEFQELQDTPTKPIVLTEFRNAMASPDIFLISDNQKTGWKTGYICFIIGILTKLRTSKFLQQTNGSKWFVCNILVCGPDNTKKL